VTRRRSGLAARITALGIAVAVITGVLAGALAFGLIRNAGARTARAELGRLADVAAHVSDTGVAQKRLGRTLLAISIQSGHFGPTGAVRSPWPIVPAALDASALAFVRSGGSVSLTENVDGVGVYVEARPTSGGEGVVLVQRHGDASSGDGAAIRRTLLAIAIGVVVAAAVGALIARRMARPLHRAAAAAHALATGRRDVVLPTDGPDEVAGVAAAVNTLAGALAYSEDRHRQFLLSVSHDLRTPLTAITGYAESLADGVVPAERAPEAGGVILAEAQRLTRLVTDLLDLARLDAHDFRIELATVDLDALVAATAAVWRLRCEREGVAFRTEPAGDPLPVQTDPGRVRQVLDGLLENALRVTPAGAVIVLAVRAEQGYAVLEVRDGGPGLRPDDLAVAFDRGELYRRYRGVRQVGTGLGLAIVAGLTTRLGGTVEAGHAVEGGARFTVRLPRQG
jgi:two-component system sensor histidine kinase BaeS